MSLAVIEGAGSIGGIKKIMKTGIELIHSERLRQIEVEGWTPEHDDEHTDGNLALVAALYATPTILYGRHDFANSIEFKDPWPWEDRWDKRPHNGNVLLPSDSFHVNREDRLRQLVKAGALIAAEIDRIQRAKERARSKNEIVRGATEDELLPGEFGY